VVLKFVDSVVDAVRVLESKGLVETQHANPQVFRAVPIDEAVSTLRVEYVERAESLRSTLNSLEPTDDERSANVTHEVWALSGKQGITSRTQQLIEQATAEVLLVIGHESVFTDQLAKQLRAAQQRGVTVLVGTVDKSLQTEIQKALPDIEVYVSGLDWLNQSPLPDDSTEISRLLLADNEAILVSSISERGNEQGVFGRGFDNGLVAIVRRLMATGLLFDDDVSA
jgi:sugar-specific transcriptional regulator TrmB